MAASSQADMLLLYAHQVIDWTGYTIGYYGRPFESRNKASCWSVMACAPCHCLFKYFAAGH